MKLCFFFCKLKMECAGITFQHILRISVQMSSTVLLNTYDIKVCKKHPN